MESKQDQGKRRGQIIIRTEAGEKGGETEAPRHSIINDECLEAFLLLLGEDALVKTGEEAFNPSGEGNFLDPEQVLGLMKGAANGMLSALGVDLVQVVGACFAVGNQEMASMEWPVDREVVESVFQHLAPDGVGLVEDVSDFLGWEHEFIECLPSLVASESSEEFLGVC